MHTNQSVDIAVDSSRMPFPGLSRTALGAAPFEAPQFYPHCFTVILQYLPDCGSPIHVAPTTVPALPASPYFPSMR
jgi:hypothetical protein